MSGHMSCINKKPGQKIGQYQLIRYIGTVSQDKMFTKADRRPDSRAAVSTNQ
jgi:hypothetical protein